MRIAAATPSPAALEAALEIAGAGGGAVDAAIAATCVGLVNEFGVCAPGSGGFVAVGGDTTPAVVYDGYTAVPGLEMPPAREVVEHTATMEYGGGVTTVVGPGSIGTPGIWAALAAAHQAHGRVRWDVVPGPAARLARTGCTLGPAVFTYLEHAHEAVFGHDRAAWGLIHDGSGHLIPPHQPVVMTDLAATLDRIADDGVGVLYGGPLGRRIADDLADRGGRLTLADLAGYRAVSRAPLRVMAGGWEVDLNPAPAVGGRDVAGVLERLEGSTRDARAHVAAQRDVFERRLRGEPLGSPSTIHVSVVDETGVACAITASSGYCSGVIPAGTGFLMNNAMGELELLDGRALIPGERLVSNMAPTVASHRDGSVLAIGSPGASRITSALAQVLSALILEGDDLVESVGRARLHVEVGSEGVSVSAEPGVDLEGVEFRRRMYTGPHMYFGGVAAALRRPDGNLLAVADPRRQGAAAVGPR